jgi:O-antigen/teichoic acid export membrane protein
MTVDSPAELNIPGATPTGAEARRVARNAGALAAAGTLSKGALFVWQLILAPLLGPHDFGIYGTVGALFAVGVPIASFGMGLIVIRDVARYPERAGRYWTALLFMQTLLAAVAYAGANFAASALDYGPTIQAYVAVACTSLLIDMFGNMGNELLLAQERMLSTSLVEIGHVLARLLLAGGALLLGYGLLGVYVATIITGVGRWWVLWSLLLRTSVRPRWPLDRAPGRSS